MLDGIRYTPTVYDILLTQYDMPCGRCGQAELAGSMSYRPSETSGAYPKRDSLHYTHFVRFSRNDKGRVALWLRLEMAAAVMRLMARDILLMQYDIHLRCTIYC